MGGIVNYDKCRKMAGILNVVSSVYVSALNLPCVCTLDFKDIDGYMHGAFENYINLLIQGAEESVEVHSI